jgi:beta-glucosidase
MHAWQRAAVGLAAFALSACGKDEPVSHETVDPVEARVEDWLAQMTLDEKLDQMHGTQIDERGLYLTTDNERLGIPPFAMVDGPRGVRAVGTATTFPVGMARGASWDPDLERRIGEAMGAETAAKGGNVLLAPTMNLLRHPRWGRAQETYGEDPRHMGALATAFIEGAQRYVAVTAKHFALNSIEDTRFTVSVQVDERTLREVYLPHFRRAVQEAKVAGVMTAYNRINGAYCAENAHLVREILKTEWGFDGFVVSDWVLGTRSTVPSALAGLDIEMPGAVYYDADLTNAVQNGEVIASLIDDAVRRILRKKIQFIVDRPSPPTTDVVESAAHTELAREAAQKSIVLLKNEGALPLDPQAVGTLAVVGQLADVANLGDHGSSNSIPSYAVTPLTGIRARFGDNKVRHIAGPTLSADDRTALAAADAAVVVVGLTFADEGEFIGQIGDRKSLALSPEHEALVGEVAALNAKTIVVLEGSGPFLPGAWSSSAAAALTAWYPGQAGGHAIAEVLAGDVNPSGKLPVTFPASEAQLPAFVNNADVVEYGYFHGYFFVDREGQEPLFPFGFGMSYTSFGFDAIRLSRATLAAGATLGVEVDVTNRGNRAGDEVVQIYASADSPTLERPARWLVAFQRVTLESGARTTVELEVRADDLAVWDDAAGGWRSDPGGYRLWAGSSSRDLPLEAGFTVSP